MLSQCWKESSEPVITLKGEHNVISSVVSFIYTDSLDAHQLDESMVVDVLIEGHTLNLPRLKELCSEFIFNRLSPSNVKEIYEVAKFFDAQQLVKLVQMYCEEYEVVIDLDDSESESFRRQSSFSEALSRSESFSL